MSLWSIAWRSIRQRGLASFLTCVSVALGVTLVVVVLIAYGVVSRHFERNMSLAYNLVIGPKGDKLQLVLNTVYHVSTPVENIPFTYYQEFLPKEHRYAKEVEGVKTDGEFSMLVQEVIPYCLGDNYEGYRVVGTVPEIFDLPYAQDQNYAFAAGRKFKKAGYFEAVIGANVARKTGLALGDPFEPTHGISGGDGHTHDPFLVVGVLAPTGTPNDNVLFVNIEGFYLLEGHDKSGQSKLRKRPAKKAAAVESSHDGEHTHEGEGSHSHAEGTAAAKPTSDADHDHAHAVGAEHAHEVAAADAGDHAHADDHGHDHSHEHGHVHAPLPIHEREVTSLLVRTHGGSSGLLLDNMINEGLQAQSVSPIQQISRLMTLFVVPTQWLMLILTAVIIVVAGVSMLVSIYNSMNERSHEIAILRALGARRGTVMTIILLESMILSLIAGVAGCLVGHLGVLVINPWIYDLSGVTLSVFEFVPISHFVKQLAGAVPSGLYWTSHVPVEVILLPALVILATLVGYLPAVTAYRTDVSANLTRTP